MDAAVELAGKPVLPVLKKRTEEPAGSLVVHILSART